MQESYEKGVANHLGPELCGVSREAGHEALVGVRAGRVYSPEITQNGVPTLSGAKVTGEIVKHGLGDKIIVFKMKRRKNYAKKQGHRQGFTEVRINDITLG